MSQIVLDLCGGTGAWSRPYTEAGYDVRIVDLRNGQDVRMFRHPGERVHGVLAAPDCTHFAGSGARWWKEKGDTALLEGLAVVDACTRIILTCKPDWWCLENPVSRLIHYLGPNKASFNPCDYGDPYTKKTLLWGEFVMPEKHPVLPTEGSKMHRMPPCEERKAMRSVTPAGFAQAFFEANP